MTFHGVGSHTDSSDLLSDVIVLEALRPGRPHGGVEHSSKNQGKSFELVLGHFWIRYEDQRRRSIMKVSASVKTRCAKCKIIRRNGRVMVICENARHKQRQG